MSSLPSKITLLLKYMWLLNNELLTFASKYQEVRFLPCFVVGVGVHGCMYMCTQVCMLVCVHSHRDQRLTSDVSPQLLST